MEGEGDPLDPSTVAFLTVGTRGGFFEARAEYVEAPRGIIVEELAKGLEG